MALATKNIAASEYSIRTADFTNALMDPSIEVPTGIGKKSKTPDSVEQSPKRFDVYRNNVVVSLMEALKATYPSIQAILGPDNFEKVTRVYVANHPPKSAMMQTYGDDFHEFLDAFAPLKNSPFLVDVAKIEQAWIRAFHARDVDPINPELLSSFPPEEMMNLCFAKHPAAALVRSNFAAADLFNFRHEPPSEGFEIEQSQNVLITRPALEAQLFSIPLDIFIFLEKILSGETLGEATNSAIETNEAFDLSSAIALLIQSGAVTNAYLAKQEG